MSIALEARKLGTVASLLLLTCTPVILHGIPSECSQAETIRHNLASNAGPNSHVSSPATGSIEFSITVTAFIPSNHVACCVFDRCKIVHQLSFAGDDRIKRDGTVIFSPSADSFRIRQSVTLSLDKEGQMNVLKKANYVQETRSYAPNALNDGLINDADNDRELNDCHLLHQKHTARDTNMIISLKNNGHGKVSVHFYADVPNPLARSVFRALKTITWSFWLTIDTSVQPRLRLEGKHDGFPAYEIYVNDKLLYNHHPGKPPYNLSELKKLADPMDVPVHPRSLELR